MQIPEMEEKNQKKLLVLKIIAFESGTRNSHNIFEIRVSQSDQKYDESALMQILPGFGTF